MSTVVLADHQSQEDIQLLKGYALKHFAKIKSFAERDADWHFSFKPEKKDDPVIKEEIKRQISIWKDDIDRYGMWTENSTTYSAIMDHIVSSSIGKDKLDNNIFNIINEIKLE